MTTWKQHERRTASRFGGKRTGNRGTATADVATEAHVSVECKHRKALPQWLHSAMRQAVNAAEPSQLPLVVLHQLNQRSDNDYVVVRMRDFVQWFGDVVKGECNE